VHLASNNPSGKRAPEGTSLAKRYNTVAVAGNGCCRFCIDCMHLWPKCVRGKLGGFLGKASAGTLEGKIHGPCRVNPGESGRPGFLWVEQSWGEGNPDQLTYSATEGEESV
jgi:hypothetical protein